MGLKEPENSNRGLVFNIQKFSLHDGPGIRTTVFMKGCTMNCKWCSNPESINRHQEIMVYDLRCIGCGKCAEACPVGAIKFTEKGRVIDWDRCNNCLACARVCPSSAIECVGTYMTVDEITKKVEDDRVFYENSKGGMTVSGGEATVQPDFIRELLRACKSKGIHTALDTTANAPWSDIEKALDHVDLVLLDIKHMDPEMHMKGTGVSNKIILQNVEKIAARVKTWFRIPLIPNFNESELNISMVAKFAAALGVEKVSVLPYHDLGSSKYEKLGRAYPMNGTELLQEKEVERAQKILISHGLKVEIGR